MCVFLYNWNAKIKLCYIISNVTRSMESAGVLQKGKELDCPESAVDLNDNVEE